MLHARIAADRVRRLAREFPAITILGPRQIGKSTLARMVFADYEYLDLEHPLDFDQVRADPWFVLSRHRRLVIDEAQRLPELFPMFRSHLDLSSSHRLVLLGSASPGLFRSVTESLAGRVSFFELGGISVLEHPAAELWVKGGFPRVHWSRPRSRPEDWFPAYLRACLEQDLPSLGFRLPSARLRTLMLMLAGAQGGLSNLSELGASLGLSYHTVAHLLDVLEGIFLIRRLHPYAANIHKRLVKAPKLYVRDTGLLHSLLGIPFTRQALLRQAKAGPSFETFCIEQILLHARLHDPASEGYFYRTHGGLEVDLVLRRRAELIPIEIKLGVTPPDTGNLATAMVDLGARRGYVVSAGTGSREIRPGIVMCGLRELLDELGSRSRRRR